MLMTVDSPSSIKGRGDAGIIAGDLGWLVSLLGWLLIPSLVGVLAASAQAIETDTRRVERAIFRAGEQLGLEGADLRKYVSDFMTSEIHSQGGK
jgi:hypothetical protein